MTNEQIEAIARKAHLVCASHLSPALLKDPNRDQYWDVMTEDFKEPWREIVRLVASEVMVDVKDSSTDDWVCECGQHLESLSPSWRWNGQAWEHSHGWPEGYVPAKLVVENPPEPDNL